ncbi:MAG: hypothetical protein Q9M97_09325 [Candidatus Gracilibacteria bacterium]|nr:hypothetical protein [Candidatus Gracilibacteria bacterium]
MIVIILLIIAIFATAIYFLIKKINGGEFISSNIKKEDFKKTNKIKKTKIKNKKEKFLNGKSYTKAKKEDIEIDL